MSAIGKRLLNGFTATALAAALAVGGITMAPQAEASRNTGEGSLLSAEEVSNFAKRVEHYAAERGARVFLLARVGRPRDEMPEGVNFTHVGIAVYSNITTETGETVQGYAIHNLYQRGDTPDVSELVVDYPTDFFTGVHTLEAAMLIPTPALQRQLLKVIGSDSYSKLHNPKYSVLANPYDVQFQNCTEHTLDVINAAIYGTDDKAQLKANTKAYFKAQPIEMNPLKLSLGSMFIDEVTLKDHDFQVQTATYTRLADYLQQNGMVSERVVLAN